MPLEIHGFAILFSPDGCIKADELTINKGEFAIIPESFGKVRVEGEGEVIYVTL